MDGFLLAFNTLILAVQAVLQLSFAGRITEKRLNAGRYAAYAALLLAVSSFCSLLPFHFADTLFNIFILYAMGRFVLKNSRSVSCVAAVLAVYIAQLSFGLINPLTMLCFPAIMANVPLLYLAAALAGILSLMLCGICYWWISSHFSLKDSPGGLLLWLLLPPGLFLFAAEFYILSMNYSIVEVVPSGLEQGKHLMLLALQALGLGVLFSSLYAYRYTCTGVQAQAALASLEQESHAQRTYVSQAKIRYENTRSFRHDIKNYLAVLDGYLKNGEMEQARGYLEKLDAAAGELSFPVDTGNPTVDILLGDKLALAKMDGVSLDLSLALPQSETPTDLDWCVIFGNALDNAIRACRQADAPKRIRILGEQQGDFYMLEFENTCPKEQKPISHYGIGLGNIRSITEKYGGAMTVEHQNGIFRLNVLLNRNISLHSDNRSLQRS